MCSRDSPLPPPPTPEELAAHLNNQQDGRASQLHQEITETLTTASGSSQPMHPTEESFMRQSILKNIPTLIPVTQYQLQSNNHAQMNSHSSNWVEYGHGCVAKNGFPRCTFPWEAPTSSHWNSTMIAVIWESCKMVHELGGNAQFTINPNQNTPNNCLSILHRWVQNKRPVWKKQNQENPDQSSGVQPQKKVNKASKRRVSAQLGTKSSNT